MPTERAQPPGPPRTDRPSPRRSPSAAPLVLGLVILGAVLTVALAVAAFVLFAMAPEHPQGGEMVPFGVMAVGLLTMTVGPFTVITLVAWLILRQRDARRRSGGPGADR